MDSLTFLHLSDLHFGATLTGSAHFDQTRITSALIYDIMKQKELLRKPDWILITGDIAWKGQEYQLAKKWLNPLLEQLRVDHSQVLMVPGNHDVDRTRVVRASKVLHDNFRRTLKETGQIELDAYLSEEGIGDFRSLLWPKFEAYARFSEAYTNSTIRPDQPWWSKQIQSEKQPVYVVGLNTALMCFDAEDSPINLAIGNAQLYSLFKDIPTEALVLILMHHPPEWLADGNRGTHALASYLHGRPYLLFCGHVHEQEVNRGDGLNFVAGAGYSSEGGQHRYSWVQLRPDGIAGFPRVWVPTRGEFRPDANGFDLSDGAQLLHKVEALPSALKNWYQSADIVNSRAFNIQSQDRILCINYQASLPPPRGFDGWDKMGTKDVLSIQATEPTLIHRLRDPNLDRDAWQAVIEQLTQTVRSACDELKGSLHLFVAAPHGVGALIGRLLEEYGRFLNIVFYQWTNNQWLLFDTTPSRKSEADYFSALDFKVVSSDAFVLLVLEVIQPITGEQIRDICRDIRAGSVYALRPKGERVISPERTGRAIEQVYEALEEIRQNFPEVPIYVATSGPLAFLMGLSRGLRKTVYKSLIILQFDSSITRYYPTLDIMSSRPYRPPEPCVYLDKLSVSNARRFSSQTLSFVAPGFNVIAGPNGAGKTTILQCIVLCLAGSLGAGILDSEHRLASMIHHGQKTISLELTLKPAQSNDGHWDIRSLEFENLVTGDLEFREGNAKKRLPNFQRVPSFAAYGPSRRIGLSDVNVDLQERSNKDGHRQRLISLFRRDVNQEAAVKWWEMLLSAEADADTGNDSASGVTPCNVDELLKLLNDKLLPQGTLDRKLWLKLKPDSSPGLSLEQTSDGIRAVLALVLDLLRQLNEDYPDDFKVEFVPQSGDTNADPRPVVKLPSIVLIDELDVHLHPSWQQHLSFWLKEHFPKIQFIVTTHSPFICQAADEGGLIRLPGPGDEGEITVFKGHEFWSIVNGSADDAASQLFGLDYAHSLQSQKLRSEVSSLETALRKLAKDSSPEARTKREELAQELQKKAGELPGIMRDEYLQLLNVLQERGLI